MQQKVVPLSDRLLENTLNFHTGTMLFEGGPQAHLAVHFLLKLLQQLCYCLPLMLLLTEPQTQEIESICYGSCLGLLNKLLHCAQIHILIAILYEVCLPCCTLHPLCMHVQLLSYAFLSAGPLCSRQTVSLP